MNHHLASKPVSLVRGAILQGNVQINAEDDKMSLHTLYESHETPFFKTKPSFDCNGSATAATECTSDTSSVGDRDSSLHDSFAIYESLQADFASKSDQDLLVGIEEAIKDEKMVLVSQLLREMGRRNLHLKDSKRQATLLENTRMIEDVIIDHQTSPEAGGWKKNCMLHGKHGDTIIYHRLNEKQEISTRIEMALDESMLVPLFAVLYETDHYCDWIPSFQRPFKFGMRETEKLHQVGRALQIARARIDTPWPLRNREIVAFNVMAEAVDEIGAVVVKVKSLEEGEHSGCVIPPALPGWNRIELDGGLMVRKCPKDHPALQKRHSEKATTDEPEKEPVLVSLTLAIRPSINIATRAVVATLWQALLSVAEDVRDGNRPGLKKAIEDKPELYRWFAASVERLKAKSM
ncbi:expressed unknown protein [Seminavis robusta]|uniref:START domain-containing protein n=1 Tax=Seminavis robusta TaxID=568900 RepID=A0A9N8DVZ8_9STRA|nr:expressed unknown protein [Seminavis robusta]|eukprot:Sro288_g108850.1 n/a (406) ;mRNA; r:52476-53790